MELDEAPERMSSDTVSGRTYSTTTPGSGTNSGEGPDAWMRKTC